MFDETTTTPLDFGQMLIGALASIDERMTTMEVQMAELIDMKRIVMEVVDGMQNHPMLKMFGGKNKDKG